MAKYIFKDGHFRDPQTGEPMEIPKRDHLAVPQVIHDIEPYESPIDGKVISGRAARREDLKKHDCIPYDEIKRQTAPEGKFKNKRFSEKWGLPLSEEALDG